MGLVPSPRLSASWISCARPRQRPQPLPRTISWDPGTPPPARQSRCRQSLPGSLGIDRAESRQGGAWGWNSEPPALLRQVAPGNRWESWRRRAHIPTCCRTRRAHRRSGLAFGEAGRQAHDTATCSESPWSGSPAHSWWWAVDQQHGQQVSLPRHGLADAGPAA